MGDDRAGGVEHHRVSDRALCPAQDGAGFGRIGLRVTAQQLVELGTCEAESRGIESQFVDGARLHPPDRAGGRRGQLVEPVVAVHHQHAGPARGKDPGHHLGEVSERAADQPRPRPGRIRQRPKQIEHRGHADLAAHHRGVPVRRMELRREAKTNPDFLEAAHHLIGIQVDAHPERFQGVGSPDNDDAARLPCLTTGTPAAATTMAAIVDRLTVLIPSPPVPTTSTASSGTAWAGIGRAWSSITPANSATSSAVGTFIVIATANAAICAGRAAPVMI
ncbi:hypothetical protein BZL29_6657 [Mycobacterium kansasii]|uniref:Uncharacterized protein n=1 Tax=Mycobacterium kansasii TaxID=1768 RepID=A0A1V3WLU8_MYCKA|nr:hypothetical protein BZL29_6657 [Mycobacterium kansasii]